MENLIIPNNGRFYTHTNKDMRTERSFYIGGSDSQAFTPEINGTPYMYSTPFIVWCQKKRIRQQPDNPEMNRGRQSEARIRERASEYLNTSFSSNFEVFESRATYRMREYPFIGANIDGIVKNYKDELCGLEIKTTSYRKNWFGGAYDGVPEYYWCQAQHYLMVTGLPRMYFICEVMGAIRAVGLINKVIEIKPEIIIRCVESSPEFHKDLMKAYIKFWEYIINDVPPKMSGISKENEYLACLPQKYRITSDSRTELIEKYIEKKSGLPEMRLKILESLKGDEYLLVGSYKVFKKKVERKSFNLSRLKLENTELCEKYMETHISETLYIKSLIQEGSGDYE